MYGAENVDPSVQEFLTQQRVQASDVPSRFDLSNEDTAYDDDFIDAVWAISAKKGEEEGKGAEAAALGVAPLAGSGAGRPAAASKPSSSLSPSRHGELFNGHEAPKGQKVKELHTRRAEVVREAEQHARDDYNRSCLNKTTEDLPGILQSRLADDVEDNYRAEKADVFIISDRSYLSRFPITTWQEKVLPGRPYLKKGMSGKEMVAILRERADKRLLTPEQKKKYLDLQTIELFYKSADTGHWHSIEVNVAAEKVPGGRGFQSNLYLSAFLSEEMGLKLGTVFVIERFKRTKTNVPVYALTIVGNVDLPTV